MTRVVISVVTLFSVALPAAAGSRPCVDASDCLSGWVCEFSVGDCARENGNCEPAPTCGSISGPVCGCSDTGFGPTTYASACEALAVDDLPASLGACPIGDSCGGQTCAANEFCRLPDGTCNEFGCAETWDVREQQFETEGVCTPVPPSCSPADEPVCGCAHVPWVDLTTYPNRCEAFRNLASIAGDGPCAPLGAQCLGLIAPPCSSPTDTCAQPCGGCIADFSGRCEPDPVTCDDTCAPVCGCGGGTWFRNRCEAILAGEGMWIDPVAIGCGEAFALRFTSKADLIWGPWAPSEFNVYRASLTGGAPPGPWNCIAPLLPTEQHSTAAAPATGEVWAYVVTNVLAGVEGSPGWGGAGCTERTIANPCTP